MKQKLHYFMLFVVIMALTIYACQHDKYLEPNVSNNKEIILYQRMEKSNSKTKLQSSEGKLDEKVYRISQLSYNSDELYELRKNEVWNDYLKKNKISLDNELVKKSLIDGTTIILYNIPFQYNDIAGFVNLYFDNHKFVWTKTVINKLQSGMTKYTTTSKSGKLLYELDMNESMQIKEYNFQKNEEITEEFASLKKMKKSSSFSIQTMGSESGGDIDPKFECYRKGYYDCMQCLIIKKCGSDWVCAVACGAFIEVCLGIAVLACAGGV